MNAMISDTMDVNLADIAAYRVRNAVAEVSCREPYTVSRRPLCAAWSCWTTAPSRTSSGSWSARLCRAGTSPHRHGKRDSLLCAGRRPALQRSRRPRRQQRGNCRAGGACGQGTDLRHLPGASTSALALGGKTEKLKYGHRGVNQPATDLVTGRTYMTSRNHGYAVVADSIPGVGSVRFRNANDGTCEGVDYPAPARFFGAVSP